eukprot:2975711-Ditylum_brightwellii.AAC.1
MSVLSLPSTWYETTIDHNVKPLGAKDTVHKGIVIQCTIVRHLDDETVGGEHTACLTECITASITLDKEVEEPPLSSLLGMALEGRRADTPLCADTMKRFMMQRGAWRLEGGGTEELKGEEKIFQNWAFQKI